MNKELMRLDAAWSVYKEWLSDGDDRLRHHQRQLTFAEWLHFKYEQARKEGR